MFQSSDFDSEDYLPTRNDVLSSESETHSEDIFASHQVLPPMTQRQDWRALAIDILQAKPCFSYLDYVYVAKAFDVPDSQIISRVSPQNGQSQQSQGSNFSDTLAPKKKRSSSFDERADVKFAFASVMVEYNISSRQAIAAFRAFEMTVPEKPTFTPSDRTLRRSVLVTADFGKLQLQEFILKATSLQLGFDGAKVGEFDYNSMSIRSDDGETLLFGVSKIPDKQARTIAQSFVDRFNTFSDDSRRNLAMKTIFITTDSAPNALAAANLIIDFLNTIFQRPDRKLIRCSMHQVIIVLISYLIDNNKIMHCEATLLRGFSEITGVIYDEMKKTLTKSRTHGLYASRGKLFEDFLAANMNMNANLDLGRRALFREANVRFGSLGISSLIFI